MPKLFCHFKSEKCQLSKSEIRDFLEVTQMDLRVVDGEPVSSQPGARTLPGTVKISASVSVAPEISIRDAKRIAVSLIYIDR